MDAGGSGPFLVVFFQTVVPMGWFSFLGWVVGAVALALFRTVNYVSKANGVTRYGVTFRGVKRMANSKNFCKIPNELRSTQTLLLPIIGFL